MGNQIACVADVPGSSDKYLAFFNVSDDATPVEIKVSCKELGRAGPCKLKDLWAGRNLGVSLKEIVSTREDRLQGLHANTQSLRLEALPDNPHRAAVLYGPTVLAGELGPEDEAGVAGLILVPALITENRPLAEWIKPVPGEPSTFRTVGVGRPRDVTLSPFYRMRHRRYAVYWDLFTPQQWIVREVDYKAELERARRLEAMTVDFAQPGEMQPERDHNMPGERTEAGEHSGRKWRHARDGGWVSFDLKVLPDKPVSLVCAYWGGETGARCFDILADGVKIATQSLQNDRPGQFFEVTYAIPEELTRGKTKISVRFQAQPGNTAGGFYGLRVIHGK